MLTIRAATIDDARLLFEWRNDELTRAMSVNSDPVEWDGHLKWLTSRLSREAPGLYIVEDDEPVGTIRIDGDEISYTIAPDHRGSGVATRALSAAKEQFGQKLAKIKPENIASIKAATRSGHIVELI